MKQIVLVSLLIVFSFFSFTLPAAAYQVEDFGVTPGTNWVPNNSDVLYETSVGNLDPGIGGHEYDAEALYFSHDNSNAYISLVTGMKQGGNSHWSAAPGEKIYPGDFALNFGNSWNNNSSSINYQFGIRASSNSGTGGAGGNQGDIYTNIDWGKSYEWNSTNWGGQNNPTVIKSGDLLGQASFNYRLINGADQKTHYLYEFSMPLNVAGMDWSQGGSLHWTMTCGNDALNLNFKGFTVTPEPISSVLFMLGSGTLALSRMRKMRKPFAA